MTVNGLIGIGIMLVVITITTLSLYFSMRVAVATGHAPPLDEDAVVPSREQVFRSTVKKASVLSFSFTVYLVRTIQLVALSLQSAQNPMPEALSGVVTSLEVTLMELPEIHFDCLGKIGAYALDYLVFVPHITLTILYALLSMRFIGIAKWRRCGIPREDMDDVDDDAEAPGCWSKFIRWFARKGHPFAMSTIASLLSMLHPVLVTRAHRVLHCIDTPTGGWRLKENADLTCYEPGSDHEKVVYFAIITCVIGLAGFAWSFLQPWYMFVRLPPPPTEAAEAADVIVLERREAAAAALDGDAIIPDAHHSQEFLLEIQYAEERAKARPCMNSLYQVGLDPRGRSCNRVCRRCNCGGVAQKRPRNLMLHFATFDEFDGIDAFGIYDSDVRPFAFWFAPLQVLVSSALGLLSGIFGGSHAAGLERSKTAHLLGGSASIALLLALGGITFLAWPYRRRDSCVFMCFLVEYSFLSCLFRFSFAFSHFLSLSLSLSLSPSLCFSLSCQVEDCWSVWRNRRRLPFRSPVIRDEHEDAGR